MRSSQKNTKKPQKLTTYEKPLIMENGIYDILSRIFYN